MINSQNLIYTNILDLTKMYEALLHVATLFSLMSGGVLAVVSTIDKLYDLKEKAHKRPGDHKGQ